MKKKSVIRSFSTIALTFAAFATPVYARTLASPVCVRGLCVGQTLKDALLSDAIRTQQSNSSRDPDVTFDQRFVSKWEGQRLYCASPGPYAYVTTKDGIELVVHIGHRASQSFGEQFIIVGFNANFPDDYTDAQVSKFGRELKMRWHGTAPRSRAAKFSAPLDGHPGVIQVDVSHGQKNGKLGVYAYSILSDSPKWLLFDDDSHRAQGGCHPSSLPKI